MAIYRPNFDLSDAMQDKDAKLPPLDPEQLKWSREGAQDWNALKAREDELRAYEARLKAIDAWESALKQRENELRVLAERPIPNEKPMIPSPMGTPSVVISGLEISFSNLVKNLILLALAAIPAMIILFLFGQLLFGWLIAKGLSVFFH